MTFVERLRAALDYDPDTGKLTWIISPGRKVAAGSEAGGINKRDGWRCVRFEGKLYNASRLICAIMIGEMPRAEMDHKNRIRHDDRWVNLREATDSQNSCNRGLRADNTSGAKGITWVERLGKWKAESRFRGQYIYHGLFSEKEDAANARRSIAKKLHASFYCE